MKKYYDWVSFRNEAASRILANLIETDNSRYTNGECLAVYSTNMADMLCFKLIESQKRFEEQLKQKEGTR